MTKINLEKMTKENHRNIAPFKLNYVSLRKGSRVSNFGLITAHFSIDQSLESGGMDGGKKERSDFIDFINLATSDSVFNSNYKGVVPIPESETKGATICTISLGSRTIDVVNIHLPFGEINLNEYSEYLIDLKAGLSERYKIINNKIELSEKIKQIETELEKAKRDYESLKITEEKTQSEFEDQRQVSPEDVKAAEEAVDTKKKKIAGLEERLRDLRKENERISSIHINSEKPPNLTVVMGDFNSRSTCLLNEVKGGKMIDYIPPKFMGDAVITKKSQLINTADTMIKDYSRGHDNYEYIENYKILLNKMLPERSKPSAPKRPASEKKLSLTQPPYMMARSTTLTNMTGVPIVVRGGKVISRKLKKNKNKYMTKRKKHYSNKKKPKKNRLKTKKIFKKKYIQNKNKKNKKSKK